MSRSLILGTAGHIDHGKTALVRTLTGTDTDRLKEEKARGITIELGFAELTVGDQRFGVVDVPGHEAFVRAMVAGAAGVDVVMLVIAADEGVMPQTREHLAIVELLDVREIVVALTKCDLVEDEWGELVEADVRETLSDTPFSDAPIVRCSAVTETGLDELRSAIATAADKVQDERADDLVRLPIDRVFTVQGTGTVVTGTLWTGTLEAGDRVRVLPEDVAGRVRGVEVHGSEVAAASAGDRTAIALTGDAGDREIVVRGGTVVASDAWRATWMLTVRVSLLEGPGWSLAHNQRVHVHLGTSEVLARCALLEADEIQPGGSGWVQLRLEEPTLARAGDRLVLRSYSPVTTIGGGVVAEPTPAKRRRLDPEARAALETLVDSAADAVAAVLDLAGWAGVQRADLPVRSGVPPSVVDQQLAAVVEMGGLAGERTAFGATTAAQAGEWVLEAVDRLHADEPLEPGLSTAAARGALPEWAAADLADLVVEQLVDGGALQRVEGVLRRAGFTARLSADQEAATADILTELRAGGVGPPFAADFPDRLSSRDDFRALLRHLEGSGEIVHVGDGLYLDSGELGDAIGRVRAGLKGQAGLGPADFREVLPVTRKHLIPILNFLDGRGVTIRSGDGREVPG